MRRIIHQRNSFNNFHNMIGGMEDEEWARWRRERDEEWEREQERERARERRKREHRQERDAMKRGTWEVTEPLTTDEENELRELKNWDLWWEVGDPITMETNWRLKDPSQQPRYDELEYKDKQHKDSTHFLETRVPPQEYYKRKNDIEKGLGIVGVRYERQPDTGFHFARIYFPRGFKHLTNEEGQRRKAATPAGYHITLGYDRDYTENAEARAAIDSFANKYRRYKEVMIPNVSVSSGDTYEIIGNSEFARDLRAVTSITKADDPSYKPHVSLD